MIPLRAGRWVVSLGAATAMAVTLIGSRAAVAGASTIAGAPAGLKVTASTAAPAIAISTATSRKGILPPKNPSRSLAPHPAFPYWTRCDWGNDGARCNSTVRKAIGHARKVLEKMSGMVFSLSAYEKLTADEQLFVTVNLERTERGLRPAVVLTKSLDKVAQVGARADDDPPLGEVPHTLPGGGHPADIGGNWAGGWGNALGADYGWMYDDGPGSSIGDCTSTNKSGCWGHRDNILGHFASSAICGGAHSELAMGAGHVTKGKAYGDSETEILVGVCGAVPTDTVLTWTRAKALLHIR
jgi:hypothetical protein